MRNGNRIRSGLRPASGKRLIALGLAASALIVSASPEIGYAPYESVPCDATTGASCKVIGIRTTLSEATITWTERHRNGTRNFCYGIGSPTSCGKVSSRASGTKNQVVSGLKPNTKYAYKFYGIWNGKTKSVVTGSFITDGSSCGTTVISTVEVTGFVLSATGDSLEKALVKATRQTGGALVSQDTTDRSGGFHFELDPGTYLISVEHPPFTSPAPFTAVVIAKKPLTIPDRILTGAFQVGGTLVAAGTRDSLVGATITAVNLADANQKYTRLTDDEGHFNLALAGGSYSINATYQGKSLSAPITVTVNRTLELPDLVLGQITGIYWRFARPGYPGFSQPLHYDAKGARLPAAGNAPWRQGFAYP